MKRDAVQQIGEQKVAVGGDKAPKARQIDERNDHHELQEHGGQTGVVLDLTRFVLVHCKQFLRIDILKALEQVSHQRSDEAYHGEVQLVAGAERQAEHDRYEWKIRDQVGAFV